MEAKKLKEKQHEIETQSSSSSEYHPTDLMDSPPPKKTMKRKRSIMQLHNKKKGASTKPKSSKSRDKQGRLDNSKSKKSKKGIKRARYSDMYDDVEARFSVMERAERVLAYLENGIPHFVKCMLPSNVSQGFWLHLPSNFCSVHLPDCDSSIVLVDEWGNEYKTSYLLGRHGLSAGWRGFSISHRLLKGDILIFHLTEPCKLQVHIVRVNGSDVIDAALCLMNLDASGRPTDSDDLVKKDKRRKKMKYVEPFNFDSLKNMGNVKGEKTPSSKIEHVPYQSASDNDGFSSEYLEGSNIPKRPRSSELNYSGTSFLHNHPLEGVTCR